MRADDVKASVPLAGPRDAARLAAIERAGTLTMLAGLALAGRSAALPPGTVAALSVAAALLMPLSLPLWCRWLPRVRAARGWFRDGWPAWADAVAAPLAGLGVALDQPAWAALAAALLVLRLCPSRKLLGRRRRIEEPPTLPGVPAPLPPAARELLARQGLGASAIRVVNDRPDLLAWVPPGRPEAILLGPRSLAELSDDELTAMIAHELGHLRLRHNRQTALLHVAGWVLTVAAAAIVATALQADPSVVPAAFLVAALARTLGLPLAVAAARRQERQAHAWALAHHGHADAFVSMIRRVHALLGSPPEPAWWSGLFNPHPSLREALAQADCDVRRQ